MEDKCFCHFNGFRVKDAEARKRIEALEQGGTGGNGGSSDIHVDMPLGLIPVGKDVEYTTELSDECQYILHDLLFNTLKGKDLTNIDIIIHNTSESVEVDGIVIENPTPRILILNCDLITEPSKDEAGEDIAGIYSFVGSEPINERFIEGNTVKCDKYTLTVNYFIREEGETVATAGITGITYDLPTTKYLEENGGNNANSNNYIFTITTNM